MPVFKFKGVDFIEFDSLLSEDEILVRDNTRKWVEEKIIPIIEQCNREGRFPRELVPEICQTVVPQVNVVEQDLAGGGVVETRQQTHQGGLAGPSRAHDAHPRSRPHVEGDLLEDRAIPIVGERHIPERHRTRRATDRPRPMAFFDIGSVIQ